ncbi:MAG: DegT/DnrJ/EryC1/StrS family aminotransferase [Candidatus Bathyarchaeota archaeon]|nr:DegT/DnrJ/EryC1/StrS family aminotransferase [Candidatus Bathyarchaeota archaeon]
MSKLAIKGGRPEAEGLRKLIPPWPPLNDDIRLSLIKALDGRRWCRLYPGSLCERFEEEFARFHDAKYGVAVANGTVALELAFKTLGVSYGEEVIVPAVTFIATASAVTEVGGIPIFADIDPETAAISPESLKATVEERIDKGGRVKGVTVVHYGGYPADLDAILKIAGDYGLFVVEDCAHAHGSEWRGRKVGAIGDMGCFSFQESKSMTAGEGGIVITNRDDLIDRARLIHNIGRVLGKPGYIHYILSSNYRMTELQAAILLEALKIYPEQLKLKHEVGEYLASKLSRIGGVDPLRRDPRITMRGYYYYVIRYDPREFEGLPKDRFIEALRAEGVPASVGYGMPLYRQPAFARERLMETVPGELVERMPRYEDMYLHGAESFCASEVTLPHQVLLAGRDGADLIVAAIEKIKENVYELL